jgi:hypothetical protein
MPSKYGIHMPNGELRNDEVYRLGLSHATLLHGELVYLPRLVAAFDGIILVRFYLERWLVKNPILWAHECAEVWRSNQLLRETDRVHFTPANEMNLAGEAYGEWSSGELQARCETRQHYEAINAWLLVWQQEFTRLTSCPAARLHWPAVAYGHNDDDDARGLGFVGLEVCRPSIKAYGVLDCHPYWFTESEIELEYRGHRFERLHAMFPNKPVFCSETGNFNVTSPTTPREMVHWFESLYEHPYVIGGTPFIWEDPSKAHWQNDWSKNPAIARAIIAATKREAAEWRPEAGPETGGGIMGADERQRYAADIWHRAGVPYNADSAIAKYWYHGYSNNRYFGKPEEPEHPSENGRYIVQAFASRILYYDSQTGKVSEGLPPF